MLKVCFLNKNLHKHLLQLYFQADVKFATKILRRFLSDVTELTPFSF